MDERANHIGRLCVAWSALELDVTILLAQLSDFKDAPTKNVILGSMDFRAKVSSAKALGFAKKPTDQWFTDLSALFDEIDNKIRPERNRMIHDFWTEFPGADGTIYIRRTQMQPRVVNSQARTKELKLSNTVAVEPEDIAQLCERIYIVNEALLSLSAQYRPATYP